MLLEGVWVRVGPDEPSPEKDPHDVRGHDHELRLQEAYDGGDPIAMAPEPADP